MRDENDSWKKTHSCLVGHVIEIIFTSLSSMHQLKNVSLCLPVCLSPFQYLSVSVCMPLLLHVYPSQSMCIFVSLSLSHSLSLYIYYSFCNTLILSLSLCVCLFVSLYDNKKMSISTYFYDCLYVCLSLLLTLSLWSSLSFRYSFPVSMILSPSLSLSLSLSVSLYLSHLNRIIKAWDKSGRQPLPNPGKCRQKVDQLEHFCFDCSCHLDAILQAPAKIEKTMSFSVL